MKHFNYFTSITDLNSLKGTGDPFVDSLIEEAGAYARTLSGAERSAVEAAIAEGRKNVDAEVLKKALGYG